MTIARVTGQAAGTFANNVSSISVAYPGNVTAGNLLVVTMFGYIPDSTAVLASALAKSAGSATLGTITVDEQDFYLLGGVNGLRTAIFSVPVTGSGSCTMQFTAVVGACYLDLAVVEYSVADVSSGRVDGTNGSNAATGGPNTGNASSTAGGVFVGACATNTSAVTTHTRDAAFASIFKYEDGSNGCTGEAIEQIVTGATTTSASWTAPTTVQWAASLVVYKAAAGGGSSASEGSAYQARRNRPGRGPYSFGRYARATTQSYQSGAWPFTESVLPNAVTLTRLAGLYTAITDSPDSPDGNWLTRT
jgi:hypothetical protein